MTERLGGTLPPALLAIVLAYGLWGFSYDDAFITYRYAASWAAGDGLRFNPGEAVLGTSAPGWALILGSAAKLSRAVGLDALGIPQWGTLLSLLALWWTSAGLPALWLPRRAPYQPWLPLLFGLSALTCRWNLELLGAETLAATALAVTAVWAAVTRRRPVLAGVLAGLAMVCRLDAALAAGSLALALLWRDRRVPWRFGLTAAAVVLPCLLWVWSATGTVWPNTLAGKRSEAGLSGIGYTGAELGWLERSSGGDGPVWVLAALAVVGVVSLVRSLGRDPGRGSLAGDPGLALVVLGGWVMLHEVFYRLAGVPFAPWYAVALLAAILGLAAWGAIAATRWLTRRLAGRESPRRRHAAAAAAMLLLVPLWLPAERFLAETWRQPPDIRTRLYAAVAAHLRAVSEPTDAVASMEIGALAYYSDRPVLDLIGLVDPGVVAARERDRLPELVAERAPEHIVVPPPFLGRELGAVMRHAEIRRTYRVTARFFDPAYEHDPVELYRRKSSQDDPASPATREP